MNTEVKVKDLKREFDKNFNPSKDYLDDMPDIQNSEYESDWPIERVGIHGFKLPLNIRQKNGSSQEVVATITGTVSLEADKAGINMSRIIRTAYHSTEDAVFVNIDKLCDILKNYKRDLETFDAHIIMKFPYRLWLEAPVSKREDGNPEGGWQYYDVTFDVNLDREGNFRKIMYVDFVYSSACPCSTALSEYAAYTQGRYGIPHSQRSVAKIGVEFDDMVWIEDIIEKMRETLVTEVLVFCKRPDEMQFALMNGAHPKFVEDAARLIADALNGMKNVKDFKVIISHLESLHAHQAISVITKGLKNSKFTPEVSFEEFEALTR